MTLDDLKDLPCYRHMLNIPEESDVQQEDVSFSFGNNPASFVTPLTTPEDVLHAQAEMKAALFEFCSNSSTNDDSVELLPITHPDITPS